MLTLSFPTAEKAEPVRRAKDADAPASMTFDAALAAVPQTGPNTGPEIGLQTGDKAPVSAAQNTETGDGEGDLVLSSPLAAGLDAPAAALALPAVASAVPESGKQLPASGGLAAGKHLPPARAIAPAMVAQTSASAASDAPIEATSDQDAPDTARSPGSKPLDTANLQSLSARRFSPGQAAMTSARAGTPQSPAHPYSALAKTSPSAIGETPVTKLEASPQLAVTAENAAEPAEALAAGRHAAPLGKRASTAALAEIEANAGKMQTGVPHALAAEPTGSGERPAALAGMATRAEPMAEPMADLQAMVDRLSEARLVARAERSSLVLPHPDFGRVTLEIGTDGRDRLAIDMPGAPNELRQALAQGLSTASAHGQRGEQNPPRGDRPDQTPNAMHDSDPGDAGAPRGSDPGRHDEGGHGRKETRGFTLSGHVHEDRLAGSSSASATPDRRRGALA